MVLLFMQNRDHFDEHYRQRSMVESVFAVLKERRGRGGSLLFPQDPHSRQGFVIRPSRTT